MAYITQITPAEFAACGDAWNELSGGAPMLGHAWHSAWWRRYGQGELLLLAINQRNRLIGVAPWFIRKSSTRGRIIGQLGGGEVCSDYQSLLCLKGREDVVVQALCDYLLSDEAPDWDQLQLEGVDPEDEVSRLLVAQLEAAQLAVHCREEHRCWRLTLPQDWEEFLAAQSRSHRKQLRRLDKRVLQSGRATVHLAADKESFEIAWDVLVDLHQRRRIALGQPGCFASDRFGEFHREVASELLAAGQLRLFWLELDGSPVAAEYQLAGGGVTYAYQAGVDPLRIDEEPGRLITIATLQHAIAEGQQAFDFLRGDEPYKAHWRAEPRQTHSYRVAAGSRAARIRHHAWTAADGMRDWLKTGIAALTGSTS